MKKNDSDSVKVKIANFILDPDNIADINTDEVKFDLYLKIREIKQISGFLQKILLLTRDRRSIWLKENEDMVNQLMDSFLTDSTLALDGMQLDSEAMKMSVELMASLKNVFNILQTVVKDNKRLKN
jgi:hypothetical protein